MQLIIIFKLYIYSIKYRFKIKFLKNHKKNENCVCVGHVSNFQIFRK